MKGYLGQRATLANEDFRRVLHAGRPWVFSG